MPSWFTKRVKKKDPAWVRLLGFAAGGALATIATIIIRHTVGTGDDTYRQMLTIGPTTRTAINARDCPGTPDPRWCCLPEPNRVTEACACSSELDERLRRDLGGVLALGGLLGHAEHRSDLRPRTISVTSIADGIEQRRVDVVSLFDEFGDRPKRCGLRLDEIIGLDLVGPTLEGVGAL